MKIRKLSELRTLTDQQRDDELVQLRKALQEKYSQLSAGGSIGDPAQIKHLRRSIARILTIKNELSE